MVEVLEEEADLQKYPDGGCSQEEFNFFKSEWEIYVRSSHGVDTTELRDQLFSCPDENLRTALQRSQGVKLSVHHPRGRLTQRDQEAGRGEAEQQCEHTSLDDGCAGEG